MKICAGDSLKRFLVSNCQEVVLPDVQCDGNVCEEVEMNRKQQKFIHLEQVGIGNEGNVHDEREFLFLGSYKWDTST